MAWTYWVGVMERESNILLIITLALVLIGILMVYSASVVDPLSEGRMGRQLIYAGVGVCAMLFMSQFDYRRLQDPLIFRIIVITSLTLLIFVLVPGIGDVRGGAQRWIQIGWFSFQPSEVAKLAIVVLLAVKLAANQKDIESFSHGYLPPVIITGLFAGLILAEKDLGLPVVIAATAYMMMVIAGVRWKYLLPSVVPAVGAILLLSVTSPHRLRRITAFLDPWKYRDDESFQLVQSFAAFSHGSIWGQGPGASEQKLHYLPAAHTDFIFAIWAEEMGLVGSLAMLALFAGILLLGVRIAICSRDLFGSLLAGGITSLIAFQAAFNMCVTVGLLPTKGLPLPFISWGGSSLIMSLTLVGILLSVGLRAQDPGRQGKLSPVH